MTITPNRANALNWGTALNRRYDGRYTLMPRKVTVGGMESTKATRPQAANARIILLVSEPVSGGGVPCPAVSQAPPPVPCGSSSAHLLRLRAKMRARNDSARGRYPRKRLFSARKLPCRWEVMKPLVRFPNNAPWAVGST